MTPARLLAAAAQRLGTHPRVAWRVLRLPRIVPESRLRARLYRSFSWPLAKRLHADLHVRVLGGSTMRVRTDDAVGRALAVSGTWEPNVTSIFIRNLSPGD